jgi:hypothetical protein
MIWDGTLALGSLSFHRHSSVLLRLPLSVVNDDVTEPRTDPHMSTYDRSYSVHIIQDLQLRSQLITLNLGKFHKSHTKISRGGTPRRPACSDTPINNMVLYDTVCTPLTRAEFQRLIASNMPLRRLGRGSTGRWSRRRQGTHCTIFY